ncbi:MAG TPA: cupin domain-containing protein [Terriglobales bacterium]|nr:cupin domain-containing protein [Terriglobales bacterium]
MQRRWILLLSTAIVVAALYYTGHVMATPANAGFIATTLAKGTFGPIQTYNVALQPGSEPKSIWWSFQQTAGNSDLYVQSNVWKPGGSTGWHTHPGHSLITVTAGTVTAYEGNDPDCTPEVYTQGMTFVDPGFGHVHILRNESNTTDAQTIAVQIIPKDQPRRIDVPNPGNCPASVQ